MSTAEVELSGSFPLSWERTDSEWLTNNQLRANDENRRYLRSLLFSDVVSAANKEADLDDGQHDMARIEAKLDLLIDITGELMVRQGHIPPEFSVNLTDARLRWKSQGTVGAVLIPQKGELILVKLYMSKVPRPLCLFGKVVSSDGSGGIYTVEIEYTGLAQDVQRLLEKIIFRHHRRTVAMTRQSNKVINKQ